MIQSLFQISLLFTTQKLDLDHIACIDERSALPSHGNGVHPHINDHVYADCSYVETVSAFGTGGLVPLGPRRAIAVCEAQDAVLVPAGREVLLN